MRGQLGDLLPGDGARPTTAPNGTYATQGTYGCQSHRFQCGAGVILAPRF
jgi:hypothetical protein